jgi:hypothetical protein
MLTSRYRYRTTCCKMRFLIDQLWGLVRFSLRTNNNHISQVFVYFSLAITDVYASQWDTEVSANCSMRFGCFHIESWVRILHVSRRSWSSEGRGRLNQRLRLLVSSDWRLAFLHSDPRLVLSVYCAQFESLGDSQDCDIEVMTAFQLVAFGGQELWMRWYRVRNRNVTVIFMLAQSSYLNLDFIVNL